MNKYDLANILAQQAGTTERYAASIIDLITGVIQKELIADGQIILSDFGRFKTSQRRGFMGTNPRTGELAAVPPRRIPVFRAGRALKRALNE